MFVARAAATIVEIELEVRVAADDLRCLRPEGRIDRRAAEVRVNDDAASVDGPAERRTRRSHKRRRGCITRFGFVVRSAMRPQSGQMLRHRFLHLLRSEERRVGKECMSRLWRYYS